MLFDDSPLPDYHPTEPSMKILGLGLSKTGTSSLAAALNVLGFSCVHSAYPHLLEQADAMLDTGAAVRFRELDVMYPGSKFILTIRDRDSWLDSCRRHWARVRVETMHPTVRFEYAWCRVKAFGTTEFDANNHWRRLLRALARRPGVLCPRTVRTCWSWILWRAKGGRSCARSSSCPSLTCLFPGRTALAKPVRNHSVGPQHGMTSWVQPVLGAFADPSLWRATLPQYPMTAERYVAMRSPCRFPYAQPTLPRTARCTRCPPSPPRTCPSATRPPAGS